MEVNNNTFMEAMFVSIHDLVSVSKLFVGFSLILMYKFFTNSCAASSSFVEMKRHALLKDINEMLPVLFTFFINLDNIWNRYP
jgi:hypothetical protein